MLSTDDTIVAMRREMQPLLETAMEGVLVKARGVLEDVEQQRSKGLAEVAKERAKGLAEVAKERANALAEVDARVVKLRLEVEAMQVHSEAQEGRIKLNIGGYLFQTSVQTLRRLPQTFFDAYFSGRYAQDVCDDGSIFVDRDGEHFGHVLEYMRDGCVSVAEPGAQPSFSLLRALKREFGYYCIEPVAELPAEPVQPEMAYVIGGYDSGSLSSMERYDASTRQWSAAAAMDTARSSFCACVVAGELYAIGGETADTDTRLASVVCYSPSSDTWSHVAPMPVARSSHAGVAVGSAIYVLGGNVGEDPDLTASVLKFDSTQGTWSGIAPMPEARDDFAACAVGSDIYVFGGAARAAIVLSASVVKYDTVANSWSTLAPMPSTAIGHNTSVLGGLVYIVGCGDSFSEVLRFDPISEEWSTLAPTPNHCHHGSSFVLSGFLYVAGGFSNPSTVLRYDVDTNTWTAVLDLRGGRAMCCAVTITAPAPAKEQDFFDSLITKASRKEHS
jgi:hypothetical protein